MRFVRFFEYRYDKVVWCHMLADLSVSDPGFYRFATFCNKVNGGDVKAWYKKFYLKRKSCPRRLDLVRDHEWEQLVKMWGDPEGSYVKYGIVDERNYAPTTIYPDLKTLREALRLPPGKYPWQDIPPLPGQ